MSELIIYIVRLHAGPFSAGARMCPGARVANMEKYVLLSEIFRKWKVTLDPPDQEVIHEIFI